MYRKGAALAVAGVAAVVGPPALVAQDADERWGFEMNVALTSTSGNDQITVLVTDGKVTHLQTQHMKLDLSGRIRYGRSGGEEVAQNMQAAVNVDLAPSGRWSPFVFGQAEKDPFRKLDLRTSSGAGMRYVLLRDGPAEASLSGAALHSYEELRLAPESPDPATTHRGRWRWIARGKTTLTDAIQAEHTTYYEPVWDQADDFLMEIQNTVRFRLTDHLAFRVAHVFERDSRPPEGVRQDDTMLTVGVNYKTRF